MILMIPTPDWGRAQGTGESPNPIGHLYGDDDSDDDDDNDDYDDDDENQ